VVTVIVAKGMNARFGGLIISPGPDRRSKFELINANGLERIAVLEGSVSITDGPHVAKLVAGEMITHAPMPTPTPGQGGHQGSALPGFVTHLPGWVLEVIVEVAIAGGIVGGLPQQGPLTVLP